jgi:hypothetical protein
MTTTVCNNFIGGGYQRLRVGMFHNSIAREVVDHGIGLALKRSLLDVIGTVEAFRPPRIFPFLTKWNS